MNDEQKLLRDARIAANILAALRFVQKDANWRAFSRMYHFTESEAMTPDEIEALCETLNLSDCEFGTIRIVREDE